MNITPKVNHRIQVQLPQGDNSEANRILVLGLQIDYHTFRNILTNSVCTNCKLLRVAAENLLYINHSMKQRPS